MVPLLDLATFPANLCPDEEYLHKPVELLLASRRRLIGLLFEFNGPKGYLVLDNPKEKKRTKVLFKDIKIVRFRGAIPKQLSPGQKFAGLVTFKDGSEWNGEVVYYLNDRYGLHLLAHQEEGLRRIFFPSDNIEAQQVSALFGQMLKDKVGLSEGELQDALALQKRLRDEGASKNSTRLGEILKENGHLSEEQIQKSVAEHLGLEFISLRKEIPDQDAVELMQEELARELGIIPIGKRKNVLRVAMVDPKSTESLNMVSFVTGMVPEPVLTTQADIDWALDVYYKEIETDQPSEEEALAEDMERKGNEAPMIRLVNNIMSQAIKRGTSDIHIRPSEKMVELIFRVDGAMTLIKEFSPSILPGLVSRIKIMSGMDIAERRLPQDGQTRIVEEGAVIDMRVSIIPTVDGESVVIRILNTKYGPLTMKQLGFTDQQLSLFSDSLEKSHGLILVTGPTGSGKSTTLYAALDVLQKKNLSIITIENPVEFHIPGVDQVQVNTQVGLTFSRVLRNVLRHDPEVIMVGEIRDDETAQISIQSAMTGHLVLSTLHTNSAVGSVGRLLDMGVEPYILGPTLLSVVAQRLLRRNCADCSTLDVVEEGMLRQLNLAPEDKFLMGKGCETCHGTGQKGRVGVYEVLAVSYAIKEAIVNGKSEAEVLEIAIEEGMTTLYSNALELAQAGTINLAQAYAIASDF